MYLSSKEHDQLRTVVMGFEVPFRTFLARRITSKYPSDADFCHALSGAVLTPSLSQMFHSEFGKITANPHRYYKLLSDAVQSCNNQCVPIDTDVPNIATLIVLFEIFKVDVNDFCSAFPNHNLLISQMEKYKYARNKLDHPQSKTLQTEDMHPVISFISEASKIIYSLDSACFWDKKQDEIERECLALETKIRENPIQINNFSLVPFTDNSIVCRQQEIDLIRNFVYGSPGALKKKSSMCVFGYGGVGKTAIVTEAIKVIVRDVLDECTINGYVPQFILFFSAKKSKLDYLHTTGGIVEEDLSTDFSTCSELECSIYKSLQIESFVGFEKRGLIIIDNLETVDQKEREAIKDFVDNRSPQNVQYIITSRNEEQYDERKNINGFIGDSGIRFIDTYIVENNLELDLTQEEKEALLEASKGNTLVLVLSLQRLDKKIMTIPGIVKELNQNTVKTISKEIANLPPNGYEIICEFMFKNTFEELEASFEDNGTMLNSLLRVFAVDPSKSIDVFTVCIITELGYQEIQPIIDLLCRYLILEKKEEKYSLNPFAEKYIIQRLLPNATESERLSSNINRSIAQVRDDLKKMDSDMESKDAVRQIINDWSIDYDGDKIAAAKMYAAYKDADIACRKDSKFHIESSYGEFSKTVRKIEATTMHPYVKFQKARILTMFSQTGRIRSLNSVDISAAYDECIWTIKTNSLYSKIMSTKTYAAILWLYGLFLESIGNCTDAIKYLEEAKRYFDNIDCKDIEYYKCISKLASMYITEFQKTNNYDYINRATPIGRLLYSERDLYARDRNTRTAATQVNRVLRSITFKAGS